MIDLLPGIQSTSSALNAERIRTEVITQNISNSMTTRGADGRIYSRQRVIFESVLRQQGGFDAASGVPPSDVSVKIEDDPRPPRLIPDPSNPGVMLESPDINVHEEFADLIVSQRAYEANLAAAKSSRTMALQTLAIGRRV